MAATTGTGYRVYRNHIPQHAIDDALRTINQHFCHVGMTAQERAGYAATACWFPEIAYHPAIERLQDHIPLDGQETWTQILLQFPQDPADPEPEYHVDYPPPDGRRFGHIACVPLTPSGRKHGGLQFQHRYLQLHPGDIVVFPGDTPHHGGVNRSPHIRYAIYLRYLA